MEAEGEKVMIQIYEPRNEEPPEAGKGKEMVVP